MSLSRDDCLDFVISNSAETHDYDAKGCAIVPTFAERRLRESPREMRHHYQSCKRETVLEVEIDCSFREETEREPKLPHSSLAYRSCWQRLLPTQSPSMILIGKV